MAAAETAVGEPERFGELLRLGASGSPEEAQTGGTLSLLTWLEGCEAVLLARMAGDCCLYMVMTANFLWGRNTSKATSAFREVIQIATRETKYHTCNLATGAVKLEWY